MKPLCSSCVHTCIYQSGCTVILRMSSRIPNTDLFQTEQKEDPLEAIVNMFYTYQRAPRVAALARVVLLWGSAVPYVNIVETSCTLSKLSFWTFRFQNSVPRLRSCAVRVIEEFEGSRRKEQQVASRSLGTSLQPCRKGTE